MEQIVVNLRKEQLNLQEDVFKHPPADYETFCKLLGKWRGVEAAIIIVEEVINGRRNAEDTRSSGVKFK